MYISNWVLKGLSMVRIRNSKRGFVWLCSLVLFCACSGSGTGPETGTSSTGPEVDADVFQGYKEGITFYRPESANKAKAVWLNKEKTEAVRLAVADGTVQALGSIPISELRFSDDKKILTVTAENQIYEHAPPSPDKVAAKEANLNPSTLETYCRATPLNVKGEIGETGYNELFINKITGVKNQYQLTKSGAGGKELVTQVLTRSEPDNSNDIGFYSDNVLVLRIRKDRSRSEDAAYFDSEWGVEPDVRSDVACHLNITPGAPATIAESPPNIGTSIKFSNITATNITVKWGRANDTITPPGQLEYKLVRDTVLTNINTASKIEAFTGPGVALNWVVVTNPQMDFVDLPNNQTYYFGLLVRDSAGNVSMYPIAGILYQ